MSESEKAKMAKMYIFKALQRLKMPLFKGNVVQSKGGGHEEGHMLVQKFLFFQTLQKLSRKIFSDPGDHSETQKSLEKPKMAKNCQNCTLLSSPKAKKAPFQGQCGTK